MRNMFLGNTGHITTLVIFVMLLFDVHVNILGKLGRVERLVERLTQKPEVPGSILGPATYFYFPFH